MFFVLSKVLGFFALPSNVLITLGLAGLALTATRFARAGRLMMAAALLLLALFGLSPVGHLLILPLEERFPAWDGNGTPDGIIVLGGALDTLAGPARGEIGLNEAAERMTVVAELARRFPAAKIVFTGGSGRLIYRDATEADLAGRLLESFGIAADRIVLEDRSRNTQENATLTKALLQPQPGQHWLLVTSAHHMPRAVGVFRAAGFPVAAYPVDYRTRGTADLLRPFSSLGDGLRRTDTAVREWVGLGMYWLTGRTGALLPGPEPVNRAAAGRADKRL